MALYHSIIMSRCIYCLKDDTQTLFTKREHVIPASLGSFVPLNPTIIATDGLVCSNCNEKIFGPLETNFIEDSLEGVYAQRLNLQGRNSVIMRDKNFKIERLAELGDKFFDQMFFFLEMKDGKVVPVMKDQIKLKRFQGGSRVFLPEALREIKKDSSVFKKISADMQKLDRKDMAVFAETIEKKDKIVALLHEFGVPYKEKESKERKFEKGEKFMLEKDYTCTINHDIGRVLAKIAFNYFAYCALQDKQTEILYSSHFDSIRNFAYADKGVLRQIIPSISEEPILYEEKIRNQRLHAHLINFLPENGSIVVRMTFFGRPAIYKVVLGTLPPELNHDHFGCGHAFDPFSHQIVQLSQQLPLPKTEDQIKASFGLFKRYIVPK